MMETHFQIQKPYLLTQLPKPLNPSKTGYVVGEVAGQRSGSRKRKRPEVAVGIDGEALNIYDVPSSRLVTSYPIPPQATFTSSPCSIRWRASQSRDVARYTYTSTRSNPHTQRITLYKDVVELSGKTTSTIVTRDIPLQHPTVFVSPSTRTQTSPLDEGNIDAPNLITVSEAGHISSLNGETLVEQWRTEPDVLAQEIRLPKNATLRVDLVTLAHSSEVISGVFGGKGDRYSVFPQGIQAGAFDPDTLCIIASVPNSNPPLSYIHFLAISPRSSGASYEQKVFRLRSALIPPPAEHGSFLRSYRVDVRSGTLLRLVGETLATFDLQGSIPKVRGEMKVPGAVSVLRLSRTSTIVLSADSFRIYNPIYESLQASVGLESSGQGGSIIAQFPREEVVLLLIDNALFVAQLEPPKPSALKRQLEGQFIDTPGRGILQRDTITKRQRPTISIGVVPGTLEPGYWEKLDRDQKQGNHLLELNDIVGFEKLMASKFSISIMKHDDQNGIAEAHDRSLPGWKWPESRFRYPPVDRKWVIYAIGRVFKWAEVNIASFPAYKFSCLLPQGNLVNYLVDTGHLGLKNIKDAFPDEPLTESMSDVEIAEAVVDRMVELDASLELLINYLASTRLSPSELLLVLRALMKSLELPTENAGTPLELLTNGEAKNNSDPQDEEEIEMDFLEAELKMGEQQLERDWGHRARALSLALSKLCACDTASTIQALRLTFKPEQILALMVLLRTELVKGAWTSLYLDTPQFDEDKNAEYVPPPDRSISVIAELLSRCVDSMGQGGWLVNDAELEKDGQDSGGFIHALKLEVSVALEGAESASYLHGLVSEVVKYASRVEGKAAPQIRDLSKPIPIEAIPNPELPLGLKAKARVSEDKIMASGEVLRRSKREYGHLVSQKVQPYRTERIVL
ncbi:hypothetical protein MKZ38_003699 [Zalerion maritima]|uniref:Utp8 beta-propeller domain-containing protein n=1 Tax=Zalerion maritima TaxID=339359 RepID=A0AAD5RY92_9PEZI|nr:hypothetical protein MKZ38_003699 [Zalerion maritima]